MHTALPVPPAPAHNATTRSFGIVSSFPPTSCGIATFSAALATGLIAGGASVDVVRCGASLDVEDVLVVGSLADHTPGARARSIAALGTDDVVIVQHEYGLYDGADGESILDLVRELDTPVIVVAHTVLSEPTPNQRRVLEDLCARAQAVVVMTETARGRLINGYDIEPATVTMIPHGAATPPAASGRHQDTSGRPLRLLTWGLLGPGKGIEWAIDALAAVSDVRPHPQYLIAGATHPKVKARDGEAYRNMLIQRAARSAAAPHVTFDDSYRDLPGLTALIDSADLVVLPYDSRDQVTSGVLVDAVAAGRPVVSTAFPHAVELLASGAGIVVPQRDPDALGAAIRSVLVEPGLADSMAAEARRLAPDLSWSAVAGRYVELGERLLAGSRVGS